jgi:UrcA family protein
MMADGEPVMRRIEGLSPLNLSILRDVGKGRIEMLSRFNRAATTISTGLAASCIFASAPASAQGRPVVVRGTPPGVEMELVRYGDLNLSFASHRQILFDRIGRAVHNVCDFTGTDRFNYGYRVCATGAWNGARPQMYRAFAQARPVYHRGW